MKKRASRILSPLLILAGLSLILFVVTPILTFSAKDPSRYLSPIPDDTAPLEASLKDDGYTDPRTWFENSPTYDPYASRVRFYTITIPKLGIKDATVAIGGEDLEDSLIQYPGTALPGKIGNGVVFGHSILPQFYDPKNYLAIFSTLPRLRSGDEFSVTYDGITYMYRVDDTFEVKATELSVLTQDADDSYMSLVTCVPPGDPQKKRRLIVRAKLVPLYNLSYEDTTGN